MKKITLYIILLFLFSCTENKPIDTPELSFTKGTFVVCEGNYTGNNASLDFYSFENKAITNSVFALQNSGAVLGDVAQSALLADGKLFIAVNNSKKIEVLDAQTLKSLGTITGLDYPRYMATANNGKIYVSDGFTEGTVAVIDSETFLIEKRIVVFPYPENISFAFGEIFVACGTWGNGTKIAVINPETNALEKSIETSIGLTDIAIGKEQSLWALCSGNPQQGAVAKIIRVNTISGEIISSFIIKNTGDFMPLRLAVSPDNSMAYFAGKDGIYRTGTDGQPEDTPLITGSYYGLEINPATGNIYTFSDQGFIAKGKMSIYSPSGIAIKTEITCGIGPNGAVFKN